MPIFIYNSLSRKKEEFKPQAPPIVNIYTCGVTVYDESHIGHARSLYIFEVIRSYLQYRGYDVKFVRNITDIDDKIIKRANELKIKWDILVEKYIKAYYEDLGALGLRKADCEPRATENIEDMIQYIKGLIDKDFAYESGGDVYFRVKKFSDYGQLSGQSIDQMREGVRIEPSELKEDPLDFALWKKSKEGEPSWHSPWGDGRPGWHIECSVMSQKFLKVDTLDIHAGGRDLIFPHHENEIAQAEAFSGRLFAKYWIHHGLLTIDGQKMAKSSGNFLTIKDVLNKYPADVLKMFYLQAHYSSPIDFTWDKLNEAKRAYEGIDILMNKLTKLLDGNTASSSKKEEVGSMKDFKTKFIEYMDDDFNTPRALSILFDLVTGCNKLLESNDSTKSAKLRYAYDFINEASNILGISFLRAKPATMSDDEIQQYITRRLEYKKQGNYKQADKMRKELEERGVILEDTREGTTWRRKLL